MRTKTLNCGYIIVPPYIIKDVNSGKMSGINVEMIEAIAKNLGLNVNWALEVGVGDIAAALNANKIDVICQTMWPSMARYSSMTLGNHPQFYSAVYAVVREGDTRFDGDLSKANNKDIKAIGIEGDVSLDLVKEKLPQAQHVALSPSVGLPEYLMELTTGKADILFMDKGSIADFSKKNPKLVRIVKDLPPARVFGEHLGVKLGDYALRDMLDMATMQLINDGVFDDMVKRYARDFNTELYPTAKDIAKEH